MSEVVWGLTASQWAAVAAVGSLLAAAVSLLSIFISLRLARQSQRVTMQIHRESGPNPILTIWHDRTTGSSGSRHVLVVRVENQGRVASEVEPPVVNQNRRGNFIVEDPRFKFRGPRGRQRVEPSQYVEWDLSIDELPEQLRKKIVYVHVATRASGGSSLRKKVLLSGSKRLVDRLPFLWN